ncbi:MAG: signal peptidase I [Pedosphaera sp.]|nr:signal peptidase I [Pedosphaera sp.]
MTAEVQKSRLPRWLRIALIGRRPRFTLARIIVFVAVVTVLRLFVLLPIRISGASMLPNYPTTGVNCVNRLAYAWHEPRRGDVVAIRLAGEHMMYIKRVVGLPGETVEFIGGQLFINGRPQPEPYVIFPCRWDHPPKTPKKLGANEYFFVGDNRTMRAEDHEYGAAERERIVGKVML